MARKTMIVSDLSGEAIEEGKGAKLDDASPQLEQLLLYTFTSAAS